MFGRAPGFWLRDGVLPGLLAPVGAVVAAATARRVARPAGVRRCRCCAAATSRWVARARRRWRSIWGRGCCGGGVAVAFITRGHGGRVRESTRVTPAHDAGAVGDEALLLAALAPTWVGADRAASARAAVAAGAAILIMDDGLQNSGLVQDLPLLVIDGAVGFGNGRVLPAGPLREPVAAAARRARAAVLIGPDATGATAGLKLPVLRAALVPDAAGLAGRRVLAFAGIGRRPSSSPPWPRRAPTLPPPSASRTTTATGPPSWTGCSGARRRWTRCRDHAQGRGAPAAGAARAGACGGGEPGLGGPGEIEALLESVS